VLLEARNRIFVLIQSDNIMVGFQPDELIIDENSGAERGID
jgi:hypothetical protein